MSDPALKIADGIRRRLLALLEDDEDLLERAEEVVHGLEKSFLRIAQTTLPQKYLHPEIEILDGIVVLSWVASFGNEVVYSSKINEASTRFDLFVPRTGPIRVKAVASYDSFVGEPHEWAAFSSAIDGLLAFDFDSAGVKSRSSPQSAQSMSNGPVEDTDA